MRIRALNETDDETGEALYWSNSLGWTDAEHADDFDGTELLPIGGKWADGEPRKYDYRNHIGETHVDGTPHKPDPRSAVLQEDAFDGRRIVMDIWCTECGQSGSFSVDIDPDSGDIQWA